jgi:hypothetical protein
MEAALVASATTACSIDALGGSGWAAGARQRVGGALRPELVRRDDEHTATGRGGPRGAMAAPRGGARRQPGHCWGTAAGVVGVRRHVANI